LVLQKYQKFVNFAESPAHLSTEQLAMQKIPVGFGMKVVGQLVHSECAESVRLVADSKLEMEKQPDIETVEKLVADKYLLQQHQNRCYSKCCHDLALVAENKLEFAVLGSCNRQADIAADEIVADKPLLLHFLQLQDYKSQKAVVLAQMFEPDIVDKIVESEI
jgi:hypothetical protein